MSSPNSNFKILLKVFTVTIVLPLGYAALIFGAWLYGRLAGPTENSSTSKAEAAYYASMAEAAQAEAEQARIAAANIPPGKRMAKDFNCTACHHQDNKLVGPAFVQIAERYASDQASARTQLVQKIKAGGKGNWGEIPMPPHPQYAEEDLGEVVDYILSLNSDNSDDAAELSATN